MGYTPGRCHGKLLRNPIDYHSVPHICRRDFHTWGRSWDCMEGPLEGDTLEGDTMEPRGHMSHLGCLNDHLQFINRWHVCTPHPQF